MELAHPFPSRPRKAFLRPRYHHSLHSSDFAQEQTTSSGLKDSKSQPWIEWESKSREKVGSSINRNLRACDIFLPTRDDIVAPCPQKQVSHPLRDKLNDRMDSDSQWTFKGEEVIGETTLYGNRLHSSRSSKSLLRGVALSVNHNESIGCVTRDINDEFSPQGIPITPTEEESNDNVNQRRALNLINHEFGSKLSKSIGCVTPPKWSRFVRL